MTRPGFRRMAVALVLPVLASGFAACGGDDDDTVLEEAEELGTADRLVGTTLRVRGEVDRVLSPDAFVINGEDFSFGEDEGTLVVGDGAGAEVAEGGQVRVLGSVERFVAADVEERLGADLGAEEGVVAAFEEEFAIVAERVTFVPESAEGDTTVLSRAREEGTLEDLVGQPLTVGGEVGDVLSPRAFRLLGDEPGEGTLVVSATGPDALLEEGGTAEVTGRLRPWSLPEVEAELGVDLDDARFTNVVDPFVFVADQVEYVAGG